MVAAAAEGTAVADTKIYFLDREFPGYMLEKTGQGPGIKSGFGFLPGTTKK
jgi:hypothetical protein